MQNKNSFDVIMNNCPFLKKIILDKIEEEITPLKKELANLKMLINYPVTMPINEQNKE